MTLENYVSRIGNQRDAKYPVKTSHACLILLIYLHGLRGRCIHDFLIELSINCVISLAIPRLIDATQVDRLW